MGVAAAVAAIRARIDAACVRAGRRPDEVRLLPITKTVPAERLREAYAAGCRRFGENRVQELVAKADELADLDDLSWAVVGHLQTNKAGPVARLAAEFQALDSVGVAHALDRRLQPLGRQLDVLIEINSSGEDSKFGLPPEEAVRFVRQLAAFDSLRVKGLMTLALPSADPAPVAACFERVREVQRRLWEAGVPGSFDELSMGMSDDFELAIAHGATCVRLGRAIFGERRR